MIETQFIPQNLLLCLHPLWIIGCLTWSLPLIYLQVRDPMPAVFFFLIDVSMNAIQTGATAAACSAISQAIADLPVIFWLFILRSQST